VISLHPLAEGQIRTFKFTKLVADSKKIEVELAQAGSSANASAS